MVSQSHRTRASDKKPERCTDQEHKCPVQKFAKSQIFFIRKCSFQLLQCFPEIFFKTCRKPAGINLLCLITEKRLKHGFFISGSCFREIFLFHQTGSLRLFFRFCLLFPSMNFHIALLRPVRDQGKQIRKAHRSAVDRSCLCTVHPLRRLICDSPESGFVPEDQ